MKIKKLEKNGFQALRRTSTKLKDKNQNVIVIVSSGAIALGCKKINLNKKNIKVR